MKRFVLTNLCVGCMCEYCEHCEHCEGVLLPMLKHFTSPCRTFCAHEESVLCMIPLYLIYSPPSVNNATKSRRQAHHRLPCPSVMKSPRNDGTAPLRRPVSSGEPLAYANPTAITLLPMQMSAGETHYGPALDCFGQIGTK